MLEFNSLKDTIYAPATSPVGNVIGIIRISGPNALHIFTEVVEVRKKPKEIVGNIVMHGYIKENDTAIDEVVVNVYRAPNSYTGEDMIEIFFHSNPLIYEKIQLLIEKKGARKAKPGEFTQRAVLHGKMDIIQAQAINAIYQMSSLEGVIKMLSQRRGEISQKLKTIIEKLRQILVKIEAMLEFPEEVESNIDDLKKELKIIFFQVNEIIKKAEIRKTLLEGTTVSIIGTPNVGKSTLFNAILQQERAIVTAIPGTTRDIISESVMLKDVYIKLYDTAGFRVTDDLVENIGVKKTKEIIENSDLLVLVLDVSKDLSEEDKKLIEIVKEKNGIIVANKTDLTARWNGIGIKISAKYRNGVEKVIEEIVKKIKSVEKEYIALGSYEINIFKRAKENIKNAIESPYIDIMAEEIKQSITNLSGIQSISFSEEILNKIFKHFCIGK